MSSKNVSKSSLAALGKLFDDIAVPLYLLDHQRRIVFCNAALAQRFALSPADLIDRACRYRAGDAGDPRQAAADTLCPPPEALAGARHSANLLIAAGGEPHAHRAEFVPLHDSAGELCAILALLDLPPFAPSDESISADAHAWLARFRLTQRGVTPAVLVGDTPQLAQVREQIRLAQASDANVLVVAPPGSDKRLVARAIHYGQAGQGTPLATLPSVDLTEGLLVSTWRWAEQMLAAGQRPTLLASDIDRLAPDLQIRLATALAAVPISPRFLATAQTPLGELVGQGHFRHDLACRLATLTIHLPALVDRIDDLPLLAQALVEEVNAQGDKQLAGFDPAALDELFLYTWPRNVAELREVVLAAHARAEGPHITSADLPDWFRHVADAQGRPQVEPEPIMLDEFLAGIELELIERALAQAKGNKTRAAELLGLNRPRFYRRLVQLGLIDASDSDA